MMSDSNKVIDSWALIAFLEDEPPAKHVEKIILEALNNQTKLLITSINLGEVWYSIARAHSEEQADDAVKNIQALGITIVPADWALTYQAAKLKAHGRIAYADCFAAAFSLITGGELVTGDHEFKQFENLIKINWL